MYKKKKEKNGLTSIVSTMNHMTSVSLGIWIGVGGRHEPEKQSGISHVIEHMLFKGTAKRSAKDLKETMEGVGGAFNGFTSDEVTCYMVKVPAKHVELGMDVLADMVLDPKFDENDFLREKSVICEEIKMYRDQPSDHVMEILEEVMWPDHSLGRPLTGTMKTVRGFKRDEIIKFKEKFYNPANIGVVAAGKVPSKKFFDMVSERFSQMEKGKVPKLKKPIVTQIAPRSRFRKGDTSQAHIALGFHSSDRNMKERFALKLMNVILGGNMSSRLFEELREKYGLCYDISSMYKKHSDVGEIVIHSGVDNRNAMKSVIAILDQLKTIRDLGVTEDELLRAKEYTKGQFLLAMEGTSSRMLWLGDRHMVHGNIPELDRVIKKLDEVTLKDVKKACERTFDSKNISLGMISNLKEKEKNRIKKELGRL